jgi:hypothetical protein
MTDWETWAVGVLNGIAAPVNATNIDTLWAWSGSESGTDRMRWFNPLNTTMPWFGAVDMNSVHVKRYASLGDGIEATVFTLGNGYYPVILANLRGSVPRQQWGNACANLGTWGTGCGWLNALYGAAPSDLTGDDMTPEQDQTLHAIQTIAGRVETLLTAVNAETLARIEGEVKAIGAPAPQDLTALVKAIQDNTAQVAAQTTELNAISTKLDAVQARINKDLA